MQSLSKHEGRGTPATYFRNATLAPRMLVLWLLAADLPATGAPEELLIEDACDLVMGAGQAPPGTLIRLAGLREHLCRVDLDPARRELRGGQGVEVTNASSGAVSVVEGFTTNFLFRSRAGAAQAQAVLAPLHLEVGLDHPVHRIAVAQQAVGVEQVGEDPRVPVEGEVGKGHGDVELPWGVAVGAAKPLPGAAARCARPRCRGRGPR